MSSGYAIRHKFVFSSDKRTSGSIAAPVYNGLRRFNLEKGDQISIHWIVPPLSNVSALLRNDHFAVNTQDVGVTYTTLTVDPTKCRFFNINVLLAEVKSLLDAREIVDLGTATYTCSYNKITDRVTITKSTGDFGLNVVVNDLLNFLGFSVGVYTSGSTYTATGSVNMYRDVVCLKSNLISFITHGNDVQPDILPSSMMSSAIMDTLYISEAQSKSEMHDSTSRFFITHAMQLTELSFSLIYLDGTQCEIRNPFTIVLSIESRTLT